MKRLILAAVLLCSCPAAKPATVDAGASGAGPVVLRAAPRADGMLTIRTGAPGLDGELGGGVVFLGASGEDILSLHGDGRATAGQGTAVVLDVRTALSTWLREAVPDCPPIRLYAPQDREVLRLDSACDDYSRMMIFVHHGGQIDWGGQQAWP